MTSTRSGLRGRSSVICSPSRPHQEMKTSFIINRLLFFGLFLVVFSVVPEYGDRVILAGLVWLGCIIDSFEFGILGRTAALWVSGVHILRGMFPDASQKHVDHWLEYFNDDYVKGFKANEIVRGVGNSCLPCVPCSRPPFYRCRLVRRSGRGSIGTKPCDLASAFRHPCGKRLRYSHAVESS